MAVKKSKLASGVTIGFWREDDEWYFEQIDGGRGDETYLHIVEIKFPSIPNPKYTKVEIR